MPQIISIIVPFIFLFFYVILSSIETGSALFNLFPNIFQKKDTIKKYISPIWETTSIFLAFFIISMFTFFPGSNFALGTALFSIVSIFLIFFVIRIIGMLLVFYADSTSKASAIILATGSLFSPIILAHVFIYLTTGSLSFIFLPDLFLAVSIISTILLISSTFFRYYENAEKSYAFDLVSLLSFFMLLISSKLFYIFISSHGLFIGAPYIKTVIFESVLFLGGIIFLTSVFLKRKILIFLSSCFFVGLLFFSFGLFELPYIVYPSVTIYNSFTDISTFYFLITGFVVGMIIIIPSFYLMYRTFRS